MSETYTTGGDTLQDIGINYYAAQSFTPVESHTLHHIDINLRTFVPLRVPKIWVYYADAYHKPTGTPISDSFRYYGEDWNLYHVFRMRADMWPIRLVAGIEYVIVVHAYALDSPFHIQWQYDSGDATYPRGIRLISTDGGNTWAARPNDDHIFAEFGLPPAPTPPPPPPVKHFAVLDITQELLPDGVIITIPTNVPSHLTLYWTDIKPLKHHSSRTIRGVTVPWGVYFCFVGWNAVEQIEPGDTLYHTFIFDEWPRCTIFLAGWDMTPGLSEPYWEPWGDTLTENHPWLLIPEANPPEYHLTQGLLTLISTDYESRGIRYYPPTPIMPLYNEWKRPLCFNAYHTHTDGNPDTHRTAIMLYTTNAADSYHIILVISRGNQWVTYGENKEAFPTRGCIDYGQGPHPLNIPDLWIQLRQMQGLPDDPTAWTLDYVRVELLQEPEGGTTILTNDYINFFYPTQKAGPPHGNERYFTFRGEVDNILSPSVGPIFKKCHPGISAYLFEHYITGDDNDTGGMGYGQYWFGQTFTPSIAHTVNSVKLLLFRAGTPGAVVVSIRATTLGKPSGADLCSGVTDGNTLPTGPPYEWREITLGTGTPLLAGTQYAIVVRSAGTRYSNRVIARLDATSPTYPGGQYVTSSTWGESWLTNSPDLMFEEWWKE